MEVNKEKEAVLKHSTLLNLLDYNPKTGIFTWKVTTSSRATEGSIAGTVNQQGYIQIVINGTLYRAHRLAWFYVHKSWPQNRIDHIDRNPRNNSISNLRDVDSSVNMHNRDKPRNNTSGTKGVSYDSKNMRWVAYICVDNKRLHLGRFLTKESAVEARNKAERELL